MLGDLDIGIEDARRLNKEEGCKYGSIRTIAKMIGGGLYLNAPFGAKKRGGVGKSEDTSWAIQYQMDLWAGRRGGGRKVRKWGERNRLDRPIRGNGVPKNGGIMGGGEEKESISQQECRKTEKGHLTPDRGGEDQQNIMRLGINGPSIGGRWKSKDKE